MIVQLMLYSLVTATFLALAATAAEAGFRAYGRSGRWVWIVALAGSIGLPVLSVVAPGLQPAGAAGSLVGDLVSGAGALVLPPVVGSLTAPQPWSTKLDIPLLMAWSAMTGGLLVLLVWSARRLATERRDWRRVTSRTGAQFTPGYTWDTARGSGSCGAPRAATRPRSR